MRGETLGDVRSTEEGGVLGVTGGVLEVGGILGSSGDVLELGVTLLEVGGV